MNVIPVVSINITLGNYIEAKDVILKWAKQQESRYICAANVHMVMEAYDSPTYKSIINSADFVSADGVPLVWLLRLNGVKNQQRVYGPTLMLHVLETAAQENISVGFYGSTPEVLNLLIEKIKARYHNLNIAYSFSPPFHEATPDEIEETLQAIKKSEVRILFVGLGCPKQEIWMSSNKDALKLVMIGVGAAFDFHAGTKPQASQWMQKMGIEWLFRLMIEPRRLWKRYLYHNPRFIYLAIMDLLGFLR